MRDIMSNDKRECPKCKSKNIEEIREKITFDGPVKTYRCLKCGHKF